MSNAPDFTSDVWADWLLRFRHGNDPATAEGVRAEVERHVDRVLDAAKLAPGMVLADIGAGEGVIAFRAIERVGPTLSILLTDVSASMLSHAESLAVQRDIRHLCSFFLCPADRLDRLADASVDVVATRAVLAYVADKRAALREFRRVLKPGGRISIAEPVLQDDAFLTAALRNRIEAQAEHSRDRFLTLLHRWRSTQYPDRLDTIARNPLVNYSERDLFEFVRSAGFVDIHLELHIDSVRSIPSSWDVFLRTSPHPWAPPTGVILAEHFSEEERALFEKVVRPTVESSDAVTVSRNVYLNATKPAESRTDILKALSVG